MSSALEVVENAIWNKPAAHRLDVAVAMSVLVAAVQAHKVNQMQVMFGARHRDIEEPALLLDLLAAAGRHV